jgi:hypothetical protein
MAAGRLLRRARVAALALALLGGSPDARAQTTFLAPEEQVEFFPGDAVLDVERDVWTVPVHAVIFEPERDASARRALLQALSGSLHLPAESVSSPIFAERARAFLPDREQEVRLVIRVAGQLVRLDPSGPDGHVHGKAEIPGAVVRTLPKGEQEWLTIPLVLPSGAEPRGGTLARLLPFEGLSVVSDVGDTVLVVEATDRNRLLRRIFLMPLEPVPGMAALYTACAAEGATFHYLSSGPWQLHEPISSFLQSAGFPRGTLLLRELDAQEVEPHRWFDDRQDHKRQALATMAQQWPGRRLILIGDSGEHDPELYGEAARRWPGQIERILIHDVTGEPRDAQRYAAAFADVPPERWALFKDAAELGSLRAPATAAAPAVVPTVPPLTR